MGNAVADGAIEALNRLGVVLDLKLFGVDKVLIAQDNWNGVDGVSMYVVVGRQAWQQLAEAKPYTYPWWAVKIAGHIALRMAPAMRDNDVVWVSNELIAWTLCQFEAADVDTCADYAAGTLSMAIDEARRSEPVLIVPKDDFLNGFIGSGMLDMTEDELASIDEADERVAAAEKAFDESPGWVMAVTQVYPWWEPPTGAKWAQLTFLPTDNPDELDDETLKLAIKVTRFGWNFAVNSDPDSEVAEIRRHLASSPVVLIAE